MISWTVGRISYGLKNEFEWAMVNEPSVFELLKFDCTYAITFSNFVLSFGSQLCRLQKHRCNV